MTGWICNAKCGDHSSDKATCNQKCSEATGEVVFIDDNGQVLQISKPADGTANGKMTAKKDPAAGELAVQNIVEYAGAVNPRTRLMLALPSCSEFRELGEVSIEQPTVCSHFGACVRGCCKQTE
jgi:hypothetical protein